MQRGTDAHPLVPFTLSSVVAYCEQGREVKAETYDSYVKEGFEPPESWKRPDSLELRFVTGVDIKQAKTTRLPSENSHPPIREHKYYPYDLPQKSNAKREKTKGLSKKVFIRNVYLVSYSYLNVNRRFYLF